LKKFKGDLETVRFVHNAENVVLLGLPGVVKSHLAIVLGIEAAKAGISVYFTNTGNLLERSKIANREGVLEKKLRDLTKFKVLIKTKWDIFHLMKKELTANFSSYQNVTREAQPSLPRTSHMGDGVKYSKIM
jgi:hypothetical protein